MVVGARVVEGALVVVGAAVVAAVVVAAVAEAAVVDGLASPSLPEQAARVSIADARTSTLPLRAIDGWYFVPTATQWATPRSNRNAETRGEKQRADAG